MFVYLVNFIYENKVLIFILSFLVLLIIIAGIVYYYYYYNTDKNQTVEDVDTKIIKSLEEGSIEERKKVLLSYLDEKLDYQGVPTGIYYLKKIDKNKRIELYKNIELKYIEKISIIIKLQDEYLDELISTLNHEDETNLYANLREKNILLNTKRDRIGSKIKEIIKLQEENSDETLKTQVSILCYESKDIRNIIKEELKKRNRFHPIETYIVTYLNNENYGNISCKKELLR